jgi:MGT family glycosyltransferase
VYVSEGTVHRRKPRLLLAALAGLGALPVQVVVTTGRHRDPRELELGAIPDNVRVERWVALSDLLPRAAAVVTTGGSGTVMSALAHGVPVIVSPSDWDQHENAWRVAWSGAGIRLSRRQCSAARLRESVERVITQPSFRGNARRLAASFACFDGPVDAARLLEELVGSRLRADVVRSAHRSGKRPDSKMVTAESRG